MKIFKQKDIRTAIIFLEDNSNEVHILLRFYPEEESTVWGFIRMSFSVDLKSPITKVQSKKIVKTCADLLKIYENYSIQQWMDEELNDLTIEELISKHKIKNWLKIS